MGGRSSPPRRERGQEKEDEWRKARPDRKSGRKPELSSAARWGLCFSGRWSVVTDDAASMLARSPWGDPGLWSRGKTTALSSFNSTESVYSREGNKLVSIPELSLGTSKHCCWGRDCHDWFLLFPFVSCTVNFGRFRCCLPASRRLTNEFLQRVFVPVTKDTVN